MTKNVATIAVVSAAGLLLAGAIYLYSARGEALMIDLAGAMGRVFCF